MVHRSSAHRDGSSPRELDLEFTLVGLDLELDLERDLVGHGHGELHPAALELEVVVSGEHVGQVAQPRGDLLSAEAFLLLDLEDVHHVSFVVGSCPMAIRASARAPWPSVAGSMADGDAPGCCGAMRTRRTPGRIWKRKGGSSRTASPSMPDGTGLSASTSKVDAVHSCHGRSGPCPPLPSPVDAPATVIPSRPSSILGR